MSPRPPVPIDAGEPPQFLDTETGTPARGGRGELGTSGRDALIPPGVEEVFMFEAVTEQRCTVGEGPLWHPDDGRVYWVDNVEGKIYRYDPETGEAERFYDGEVVGAFAIQADGSLLLFMEEGRVAHWDGGDLTDVIDGIPQEVGMRFNDVIADPQGRVFCGTMDDDDLTLKYPTEIHVLIGDCRRCAKPTEDAHRRYRWIWSHRI